MDLEQEWQPQVVVPSFNVDALKAVKKSVHKDRFLFSKEYRIKKQSEFTAVFNNQQKIVGKYLVLYLLDNNQKTPRLGVVVSKKQVPKSVDRNRFKRLIKESIRLKQKDIIPLDLVVVIRRIALRADNNDIRQCLSGIIKKLAN
ncbi:MAG: ribonuclease P protein component [Gammaproteobacteria bacterium RIFCSPHIGHO2_12_FULL_41_15]|nr:MAG: ribonuclease P protein component [Gammaproteobacteria bacterium RIFCSPHIGHO2_12_FULL_41_15]